MVSLTNVNEVSYSMHQCKDDQQHPHQLVVEYVLVYGEDGCRDGMPS